MKSSIKIFRLIALLEGISFLVLIAITMPLKYMFAMPIPNKIFGMIHGVLFIAFIFFLIQVRAERKWGFRLTVLSLLASIFPFGTFILDKKVLRPIAEAEK